MGDFIRGLLEERKQKHGAIADAAGLQRQNFSDMLKRQTIGEDTLVKVGRAMGLDLVQLVRYRKDQLMGLDTETGVADPQQEYGRQAAGPELVVHLDQYSEEVQLKILRFLQQQPKRKG